MSMLKRLIRALISPLRLPFYKISYYLKANYQYYRHCCLGRSTPEARLKYYLGRSFSTPSDQSSERLALFVAYHPGQAVPLSNWSYLQALKAAGFTVIYIHNGALAADAMDSLRGLCSHVFCRLNIGQDFGAWKDGYMYASAAGMLDSAKWLLMCNDSNFFMGGDRGKAFVSILHSELEKCDVELIALNKNYELWQHYQSYFLCFSRCLFRRKSFAEFWASYRPLSHRYHAINNGEIALTRRVLDAVPARVLYESTGLLQALGSVDVDPEEFYSFLPQNAMYLRDKADGVSVLTPFHVQQVMALLDFHNPSHAYALHFVRYLSSPFLKKDLFRQGVCSLPQIAALLAKIGIEYDSAFWREVIGSYQLSGRHTSYIRYPRDAFLKGINPIEGAVFSGYGNALVSFGLRG